MKNHSTIKSQSSANSGFTNMNSKKRGPQLRRLQGSHKHNKLRRRSTKYTVEITEEMEVSNSSRRQDSTLDNDSISNIKDSHFSWLNNKLLKPPRGGGCMTPQVQRRKFDLETEPKRKFSVFDRYNNTPTPPGTRTPPGRTARRFSAREVKNALELNPLKTILSASWYKIQQCEIDHNSRTCLSKTFDKKVIGKSRISSSMDNELKLLSLIAFGSEFKKFRQRDDPATRTTKKNESGFLPMTTVMATKKKTILVLENPDLFYKPKNFMKNSEITNVLVDLIDAFINSNKVGFSLVDIPLNSIVKKKGKWRLYNLNFVTRHGEEVQNLRNLRTDHVAPEIHFDLVASEKSDSWTFGVLLLKLCLGRSVLEKSTTLKLGQTDRLESLLKSLGDDFKVHFELLSCLRLLVVNNPEQRLCLEKCRGRLVELQRVFRKRASHIELGTKSKTCARSFHQYVLELRQVENEATKRFYKASEAQAKQTNQEEPEDVVKKQDSKISNQRPKFRYEIQQPESRKSQLSMRAKKPTSTRSAAQKRKRRRQSNLIVSRKNTLTSKRMKTKNLNIYKPQRKDAIVGSLKAKDSTPNRSMSKT